MTRSAGQSALPQASRGYDAAAPRGLRRLMISAAFLLLSYAVTVVLAIAARAEDRPSPTVAAVDPPAGDPKGQVGTAAETPSPEPVTTSPEPASRVDEGTEPSRGAGDQRAPAPDGGRLDPRGRADGALDRLPAGAPASDPAPPPASTRSGEASCADWPSSPEGPGTPSCPAVRVKTASEWSGGTCPRARTTSPPRTTAPRTTATPTAQSAESGPAPVLDATTTGSPGTTETSPAASPPGRPTDDRARPGCSARRGCAPAPRTPASAPTSTSPSPLTPTGLSGTPATGAAPGRSATRGRHAARAHRPFLPGSSRVAQRPSRFHPQGQKDPPSCLSTVSPPPPPPIGLVGLPRHGAPPLRCLRRQADRPPRA